MSKFICLNICVYPVAKLLISQKYVFYKHNLGLKKKNNNQKAKYMLYAYLHFTGVNVIFNKAKTIQKNINLINY